MHIRNVIALGSFAVALPLVSLSAQSPAPEPPKWSFSFGVDPTHLDLHTPDPGVEARMVANLTRSWQSPGSRFARHISLMMGTDAPRRTNPSFDPQCDCEQSISRRYAGLTAGASYDLFTASRFTPYLKGGTGIYYKTLRTEPTSGALTPSQLALFYPNGFYQNGFSVGGNAGLGIKARFGSREVFIEQMLHVFDIGLNQGIYPFSIGIRF